MNKTEYDNLIKRDKTWDFVNLTIPNFDGKGTLDLRNRQLRHLSEEAVMRTKKYLRFLETEIDNSIFSCYGACLGDYISSRFISSDENYKDFELFTDECQYTATTIMTLAVYDVCQKIKTDGYKVYEQVEQYFNEFFNDWSSTFPKAKGGYDVLYNIQLNNNITPDYFNNIGNPFKRVSPIAWLFDTFEEVEKYAEWSSKPTHMHPDSIKGTKVIAICIFLARKGYTKKQIREYVEQYYRLKSCEELRPIYKEDLYKKDLVPVAIECFLESTDFEDAIRLAVSMGKDINTVCTITSSIASAFYYIPDEMKEKAHDIIRDIVYSIEK